MALGRLGALSALAARWGDALARAIEGSPGAARVASSAFWALLAAVTLSLSFIMKRKAGSAFRIAAAAAFAAIALGDSVGWWSTPTLVAGWLSYQGL